MFIYRHRINFNKFSIGSDECVTSMSKFCGFCLSRLVWYGHNVVYDRRPVVDTLVRDTIYLHVPT